MKILAKKLSLKEFEEYVNKKDFGVLPPTFLVLHHTWRPTKEQWQGATSISGLKSYYEGLGWSAGPHLFIAEDGIWLFTDMYDVGIHAGAGNGTLKTGYSIGIEVVGNYDGEVWSGETYSNTVGAIKVLQEKLKISDDKIKFHRDYSSKTCPGSAITKEWVFQQLKNKETQMATKYYINSDLRNELQKFDKKFNHEKESDHKKMADLVADAAKRFDENVTELVNTKHKLGELTANHAAAVGMLNEANERVGKLDTLNSNQKVIIKDLEKQIKTLNEGNDAFNKANKDVVMLKQDGKPYFYDVKTKKAVEYVDKLDEPRTIGYYVSGLFNKILGL